MHNTTSQKESILPFAVYSTKEVAKLLALNVNTIQKYIKTGRIKATNIGGKKKKYKVLGINLLEFFGLSKKEILSAARTPDSKDREG